MEILFNMHISFVCIIIIYMKFSGGSDDSAGCAVMLEILRIITQSPKILKYSVVFLFNGAEENILQVY